MYSTKKPRARSAYFKSFDWLRHEPGVERRSYNISYHEDPSRDGKALIGTAKFRFGKSNRFEEKVTPRFSPPRTDHSKVLYKRFCSHQSIGDMAGTRAPIPPVSLPDNEVLMEDMALYAERVNLQGMMQEYLRR